MALREELSSGVAMTLYRLYHFHDGKIARFVEFEAADDAEATIAAAVALGSGGGQLWKDGKKLKAFHSAEGDTRH